MTLSACELINGIHLLVGAGQEMFEHLRPGNNGMLTHSVYPHLQLSKPLCNENILKPP